MFVSVLLIGSALALPAQAQDSPPRKAQTSAEHRKGSHLRHSRHGYSLAQRMRRWPAIHQAFADSTNNAALRHATFYDNDGNGRAQRGLASWYGGPRWHGSRTSSGAIYDENALTAAHATLPIGTKVRVTVVDSGRDVVVTINDRPGTRSRIIDLSRAAARQLGIIQRGVAMVTLTPL
jgi:rare lipoprotein A (peptidoglycan hydrolase)